MTTKSFLIETPSDDGPGVIVQGVFSTRAKAEAYNALLGRMLYGGEAGDISEVEVDPDVVKDFYCQVAIGQDGHLVKSYVRKFEPKEVVRPGFVTYDLMDDDGDDVTVFVWRTPTLDEKKAYRQAKRALRTLPINAWDNDETTRRHFEMEK